MVMFAEWHGLSIPSFMTQFSITGGVQSLWMEGCYQKLLDLIPLRL